MKFQANTHIAAATLTTLSIFGPVSPAITNPTSHAQMVAFEDVSGVAINRTGAGQIQFARGGTFMIKDGYTYPRVPEDADSRHASSNTPRFVNA